MSDVETALARYGGGNTYVFKPGIYAGQITVRLRQGGTRETPTRLESEEKHKAILHGSLGHGISVEKGADFVVIDGFEARCAAIDGIKSNADYTVVRNCWVHHNIGQGIGAHGVRGSVIERNLVEFNGNNIQFNHGLYISGEEIAIRRNVVRFNSAHGVLLYPRASVCRVENNLVHGNIRSGILVYSPQGGGRNEVVHNTVVDNGYGLCLKNGNGEVIANNILSGNTKWQYASNPVLSLDSTRPEDLKIDSNLVFPEAQFPGQNTIHEEPDFLAPQQGVFYLKAQSPAIGQGSLKYRTADDFLGLPRSASKPPDLGCFSYHPGLLSGEYRKSWYYGWPFQMLGKGDVPDLWARPSE